MYRGALRVQMLEKFHFIRRRVRKTDCHQSPTGWRIPTTFRYYKTTLLYRTYNGIRSVFNA